MILSQFKQKLINLPESEAKELIKQVRKERFIKKEKPKKKKKKKSSKSKGRKKKKRKKKKKKSKPYSKYTNKDILILLIEGNQKKIQDFKENAPQSKIKIMEQHEEA